MATSTKIAFGLVDVTAKSDSTLTAADKQAFVDLDELKQNTVETTKTATFEPFLWRADGTFSLFPDDPSTQEWGWWSASMSDSTGAFSAPPVLTVTFSGNHTSLGVTLYFHESTGDYCDSVNIKWYDAADALLENQDYTPDAAVYFCSKLVEDYRKVVIAFNSTNKPYRFLKLSNIAYGQVVIFGSSELVTASVHEEINPLSAELAINTLGFRVHSDDANFNILNPAGVYQVLQQYQPLTVEENVNGVIKLMGVYYLDEWENDTENTVKMDGIDLLGVIDRTTFKGGIYSSVAVGTIIAAIMASAGAEYDLDAAVTGNLSGWIPICSHREALQQVAFAVGAVVDCSRSSVIKIYPPKTTSTIAVEKARKLIGQKVKQKALVTGVELTAHNYTATADAITLFDGTLAAGTHEIVFSEPAHTLSATGATVSASGANYATLTVASPGTVTLTGKKYRDDTQLFGKYAASLPAGEKTNVLKVADATLVSSAIGQTAADRVYAYYQARYQNELSIILNNEAVGEVVTVESLYDQSIEGTVEQLDINLTGGYLGKAIITGTVAST